MTPPALASVKFLFGALMMLMLLSGCATPPPADDPDAVADFEQINDPLEPTNRAIFSFNNWLYDNVLTPVAKGYRAVVPKVGRDRVADFLANLKAPTIFGNDLLQGNINRAAVTLARFTLNLSFGVGGLMDVATPLGLPGHVSDVGETFAVWGIGEGPYLVLPVFSSSNLRDVVGLGIDSYADPLTYYLNENHMRWVALSRSLASGVSVYERNMDAIEDIKRTSLDYYSAIRSLSRQRRAGMINEAILGTVTPDTLSAQH